jgi:hypothetical protein
VRILRVGANHRQRVFEVVTQRGDFTYPFAKLGKGLTAGQRVAEVFVDEELAGEAFTFRLESGEMDSIHIEQVLDYNQDPEYLKELLLYQLSLEARKGVAESSISKRQLARKLGTSPSQLYRLLDQTYTRKSVGQMLALLHLLDRKVELVVRAS